MMFHDTQLAGTADVRSSTFPMTAMQGAAGLTAQELDLIAAALGPQWCLARHQDLDGEAMAVIMAADSGPEAPSWVIHREGRLLRLDVCRDDAYARHGAYPALAPLLASLRAALADALTGDGR